MKKPRKSFVWLGFLAFALSGLAGWQRRRMMRAEAVEVAKNAAEESAADAKLLEENKKDFTTLLGDDSSEIGYALIGINNRWHDATGILTLESMQLASHPATLRGGRELLRQRLEVDFEKDFDRWYEHLWGNPRPKFSGYPELKGQLYGSQIDNRFKLVFTSERKTAIRLDQIRWSAESSGQVNPILSESSSNRWLESWTLEEPKMVSSDEADFLEDEQEIFGIVGSGRVKAYPSRLLDRPYVINDFIGAELVTGITDPSGSDLNFFFPSHGGEDYRFMASGLVHVKDPLFLDRETLSLWSSANAKPVVGPLVGKAIRLKSLPVEKSTWGQWRKTHPESLVMAPLDNEL